MRRQMTRTKTRTSLALFAACAAAIAPAAASAKGPAPVKRIFVVVLENKGAGETFAKTSAAPYLSKKLRAKGAYLPNYFGIGHPSLTNYIAMVSGQGPNPQTQKSCTTYTDFAPATPVPPAAQGQFQGSGCLYPATVPTLMDQVSRSGRRWKGYMEDMGTSCRRPELGKADPTQVARPGDGYAARHNPFVYFRSVTDTPACAANVVDLSALRSDLRRRSTTPAYSMIVPNLCNDGHDSPCQDGSAGGLPAIDAWLKRNIPPILRSPGFRRNGLLVVTFDEAEIESGAGGDNGSCCGELPGPNVPLAGVSGVGGGRTGTVLISPCIEPHSKGTRPYNHYSLLRSTERLFGLGYLGFANQPYPGSFGKNVFDAAGEKGCRG